MASHKKAGHMDASHSAAGFERVCGVSHEELFGLLKSRVRPNLEVSSLRCGSAGRRITLALDLA